MPILCRFACPLTDENLRSDFIYRLAYLQEEPLLHSTGSCKSVSASTPATQPEYDTLAWLFGVSRLCSPGCGGC